MRHKAALLTGLVLALPVPAAFGQTEEGVTVDPGSPAGKEYALPIDRARKDAAKRSRTPGATASGRAQPTPAFGEGVGPDESDRSPSSAGKGAGGGSTEGGADADGSGSTTTPDERARESAKIDREVLKAGGLDTGGSDGSLALLVGGVGVMGAGLAAGLLLRRRRLSVDEPVS